MAGHSHWAQIKRQKGAADVKRGQLFSKLSKEITIATKMGGGDPGFNPRLRTAIETARGESMPVDKIERAVKKGTGELEGESIEEVVYEGYGPGGVAVMVETATDNKNRTAAEVRAIFSKNGGNLGGVGSVAWMFKKKGYFLVKSSSEDAVLEATLEAGAEDIQKQEQGIEVICPPEKFDAVDRALKKVSLSVQTAKFTYIPENTTPVSEEEMAKRFLQLVDQLEDNDDVQQVHANADISQILLAKLVA